MREIASRDSALEFLEECVDGKHGALAGIRANQYVAERAYGKVPQEVAVSEEPSIMIVESLDEVRKRIEAEADEDR